MRFKDRINSDSGVSSTIEMIFMSILLVAILMTVLDAGIYFLNRNAVVQAAQNGARNAAVLGGTATKLNNAYGVTADKLSPDCSKADIFKDENGNASQTNAITCGVMADLQKTAPVNTVVTHISCGPTITKGIGDRTWCTVKYVSRGVGGSLSLFAIVGEQTVTMTAESEVVHD